MTPVSFNCTYLCPSVIIILYIQQNYKNYMGQSCSKDSVHKARPASLDPAPQDINEIADSNEDSELEKNRNSGLNKCTY